MTRPVAKRFARWRRALSAAVRVQGRVLSAVVRVEGRLSDRAEWRLTEHFFRAMFDFGIFTEAGADSFKRMLLGGVGIFYGAGFLVTRIYAGKYAMLSAVSSPEPYRRAVLGDDLLIIGLPMLLVAFVTLLVSHSLFPDERDFRILGPLPVRKEVVFGAKLAALVLFTGLFIAVAHVSLLPLMLLTSMNPWAEHAVVSRLTMLVIASVGASAFTVLAMTAIVGVLMLALSRSRLHALTAMMRSALLAVLVLCVPLVFHLPTLAFESLGTSSLSSLYGARDDGAFLASGSAWLTLVPSAWFVGLQRVMLGSVDPGFVHLTGIALAAVVAAAMIVSVTYILLFRQFERLMLRSAAMSPPWFRTDRTTAFTRSPSKVRWSPSFRAVYRFTVATLRRSQLHQGVLVGLSACGVGIAMNRLIGADLAGWLGAGGPLPSSLASAAMWTPFALMFACGLGVRAALALPMEHRANWIFRLTENEATRREQLRAVDHVVTTYVVAVPVAITSPLLWVALGPTALIAAAVVALVGLVFVHAVLLDWRRIPFTCSYLPGKRFVTHSLVFGFIAYLVFTLTGSVLVRAATAGMRPALITAAALSLAAGLLRRRRLAIWSDTPLMFEDEFPDQPIQLRL
jgi:hypothetical protein